MYRGMIRSVFWVGLFVCSIHVSGIAQSSDEDTAAEQDLIVMQEGTRIPGTILRQSDQKIVYEMEDPESVVQIPLRDIYSLNGLSVQTYERMSSYLEETHKRIEQLMGKQFDRDPSFRVASQTDFNNLHFPRASFPSRASLPGEVELYNELGILQGENIDRERVQTILEDIQGPMQLHPERPYLLVLPDSKGVTKTTDGHLSYLDRFRIAHLAAHLYIRQKGGARSISNKEESRNTDAVMSGLALSEGRANYLALLCLQREMGLSAKKPYPLVSLLEPSVHYSTVAWSQMPNLLRERYWRLLDQGFKRSWLEVALGGRRVLRRSGIDEASTTRELADIKPYFSSQLRRTHFQTPSQPDSNLSQWARSYSGSLGYQVTAWVYARVTGETTAEENGIADYVTDRFYDLESKGEKRRMMGWVVHWNRTEQAREFYEQLRNTLDNRPWSLEPGWQGGNHQFYQRGNRRVSVDLVEQRVFLIIAPSASAHNQLFERMKELSVDSGEVKPSVEATEQEFDRALDEFNRSSQIWSRAGSTGRTVQAAQRIVSLDKPFVNLRIPSFWSLVPDSSTGEAAIRLTPREEPQEHIEVHVFDLDRSFNESIIGLIRLRTLRQTAGISSVRRVDASKALRQGLDRDDVRLVEILQYNRLSEQGTQRQVQEVLLRQEDQLFVFQLESASQPDPYLVRTFQEVLRTTSFRKKTE